MFSKKRTNQIPNNFQTPQSLIKDTKLEECKSVVFSKYYDLPSNQVLYWTLGDKQEKTKLKIFSMNDLKTSLREREFNGEYRLLGVFPDGTLLFNNITDLFHNTLMKISSNSLMVLSDQQWKGASSAGIIDNNHFFIIGKDRDQSDSKLERYLTIFKWDNGAYVEESKTQLSVHPSYGTTKIHSLGNNRYACHLRGNNTTEFRVLVFDIDPSTKQVQERGVFKPTEHPSGESAASGECVVLSNSQILTYHHCHDHVQIWDTEDLHCVKEWEWDKVKKQNNFDVWCLKIIPLNDSINLLVYQGDHYYLFNTDKLLMNQVILDEQFIPNYYGNEHVLDNGKVLAFDGRYNNKAYNQVVFDSNEIISVFSKTELNSVVNSDEDFKKFLASKGISKDISEESFNKIKANWKANNSFFDEEDLKALKASSHALQIEKPYEIDQEHEVIYFRGPR